MNRRLPCGALLAVCLTTSIAAETLAPGWHLLVNTTSKPLNVTTAFGTPTAPVANLTSGVTTVWVWDAASSTWGFYTPAQADGGAAYAVSKGYTALTQIPFNRGFWLNVASPISWSPTTYASSAEAFLPGWHLLGNLSAQPLNVAETFGSQAKPLADLTLGVTTLWTWDTAANGWRFYTPAQADGGAAYAASKGYGALSQIPAQRGFWLNAGSALRLSQGYSDGLGGPQDVAACPADAADAADAAAPLFDTLPIALDDFIAFRPLGFMSTPIHMFPAKHSAFSMTPLGQTAQQKPVRAPGKMTVGAIYEASFSTGGKNYQVFMYPCREVRVYFGHLATLSAKMKAEFDKATPSCNAFNDGTSTVTTCRRENLSLSLESGEEFGTGPDTAGVDFGVLDFRRRPAAFVNLAHYDAYYPYYVSPLELFTPSLRLALEGKTGSILGGKMRTAAPIGGSYMQDVLWTAQGNWFVPGIYQSNATDESPMLGLARDYVDPTQPIMTVGNSVKGMKMGLYSFQVESSGAINRDFAEIKADGKLYCFDNFLQGQTAGGVPLTKPNGAVLLTMPTELSLKVESIEGASCSATAPWVFSANAALFER